MYIFTNCSAAFESRLSNHLSHCCFSSTSCSVMELPPLYFNNSAIDFSNSQYECFRIKFNRSSNISPYVFRNEFDSKLMEALFYRFDVSLANSHHFVIGLKLKHL